MQSTDSCANNVTKTIVTILSVSSVSKFIPTLDGHKTMTNGQDATNVIDGYD